MAKFNVIAHWTQVVDLDVEAESPEAAALKVEEMWDNNTLPAGDWVPNTFEVAREVIKEVKP